MTIEKLNSSLTSLLKSYIKKMGYVDSGKLLNSIDFNCVDNKSGFQVNLNAEDYILYLEKGELLNNFFELQSTIDLITQFQIDKITDSLA